VGGRQTDGRASLWALVGHGFFALLCCVTSCIFGGPGGCRWRGSSHSNGSVMVVLAGAAVHDSSALLKCARSLALDLSFLFCPPSSPGLDLNLAYLLCVLALRCSLRLPTSLHAHLIHFLPLMIYIYSSSPWTNIPVYKSFLSSFFLLARRSFGPLSVYPSVRPPRCRPVKARMRVHWHTLTVLRASQGCACGRGL